MEVGGFIEMQFPKGREYYKDDKNIARLNSGRMGIWHAFRVTGCKRIWIPIYLCDSVRRTFEKKGIPICFYHQDANFNPIDIEANNEDAVLLVNYFGIMSCRRMTELSKLFKYPIIDCSHAFFCKPIEGALTVYSCRKFVGSSDGSYVIGKNAHKFVDEYPQSYSSCTSDFLLKRIEYGWESQTSEARILNECRINREDCMKMSKLTCTLMDAEDYEYNKGKRKENFAYAHSLFNSINKINPYTYMDKDTIPMMYPLLIEDDNILPKLQKHGYYQWHLWSYICEEQPKNCFEYWISRFIIPIVIDQRYGLKDLDDIAMIIK